MKKLFIFLLMASIPCSSLFCQKTVVINKDTLKCFTFLEAKSILDTLSHQKMLITKANSLITTKRHLVANLQDQVIECDSAKVKLKRVVLSQAELLGFKDDQVTKVDAELLVSEKKRKRVGVFARVLFSAAVLEGAYVYLKR